jgi:hypothetical protein
LENNWLQVFSEVFAFSHNKAEVVIINTVNWWNSSLPFFFKELESAFWDTDVVTSSINDGGHLGDVVANRWFFTVIEVLTFESPLFDRLTPVWSISEGLNFLESINSANDLIFVDSSENGIWLVIKVWTGDTEAHNSLIDDSFVFQIPNIVEISLIFVWMDSKTKDAINIVKTFGLVESKEILMGAWSFVSINANKIVV